MLLDRGLRNWPGETTLLKEQESARAEQTAWRREQAVREQIRVIGKLVREGRFTEALPAVESALREHPDDQTLAGFRQQIRRGAGLQEATRLLAEGHADKALRLLEELAPDYPNDPDLRRVMGRCREALRERERLQAIAELSGRVREMVDGEDFDGALSVIDDGLRRWPRSSELTALRESIEAQKAASERCRAFTEELAALGQKAAETVVVSEAASMLARAQSIVKDCPEVRNRGAPHVLAQLSDMVAAAAELDCRQYARVLEMAAPHLANNPQHATFAQLAAEARRGERLAQVENARLTAARETNLEARARILQEAFERFPDEPSLETELRLTREKLNLAASTAREALALEAAGNMQAALEKWNRVRAVHKDYPDLSGSIVRVEQALRQAHANALAEWLSRIERQIEAGDLVTAAETVRRAKAEFPNDREIAEAARRIDAIQQARARARELLEQGKSACERGDFDTGRTRLHQAFKVHNDAATRTLVLTSLTEFSRTALYQGDLHQAETLAREAVSLDPGYTAPAELTDAIAEGKKSELVRACLTREEQLRSAGDLRAALGEVEQLLAAYPQEPQLRAARERVLNLIRGEQEKLRAELSAIGAAAQSALEPANSTRCGSGWTLWLRRRGAIANCMSRPRNFSAFWRRESGRLCGRGSSRLLQNLATGPPDLRRVYWPSLQFSGFRADTDPPSRKHCLHFQQGRGDHSGWRPELCRALLFVSAVRKVHCDGGQTGLCAGPAACDGFAGRFRQAGTHRTDPSAGAAGSEHKFRKRKRVPGRPARWRAS